MNFASALFSLRRGHKIKRHHWTGYWYLDSNHEVMMHTYDNHAINIRDSADILYTLENMACDDWEICDEDHATKELSDKEKKDIINNTINLDNNDSDIIKYMNNKIDEAKQWLQEYEAGKQDVSESESYLNDMIKRKNEFFPR